MLKVSDFTYMKKEINNKGTTDNHMKCAILTVLSTTNKNSLMQTQIHILKPLLSAIAILKTS